MSNFSEGEAGEQGACGSLGVELDLVSGEESFKEFSCEETRRKESGCVELRLKEGVSG